AAVYAAFMDTERIETLGTEPLSLDLDLITAAGDKDELAAALGALQRAGVPGLIAPFVDVDAADPTRYLVHLEQDGLGLPDEAYYRDETHQEVLAAYAPHIARMLELAGVATDAEPAAPARHRAHREPDGLGLPGEAYYRDEPHQEVLAAHAPHIARMLELAGVATDAEATAAAQRIVTLETNLAEHHWDNVRSRDAQ